MGIARHGHAWPNRSATNKKTPTAEYTAWRHMLARCTNPNCSVWPQYGGRGIAVCSQWRTFENFLADVGLRPSHTHSIGRIDNDGNYEPGNVEWQTWQQQVRNTRLIHLIEVDGVVLGQRAWADRLHVPRSRLRRAIDTLGREAAVRHFIANPNDLFTEFPYQIR